MGDQTAVPGYDSEHRLILGENPFCTVRLSGHRSYDVSIHTTDDDKAEGDETFAIVVGGSSGVATLDTAAVILKDNEPSPGQPGKPTATLSTGVIEITWSPVDTATEYKVRYSTNAGGNWTGRHPTSNTSESFDSPGAGVYVFQVSASNPVGDSAWSESSEPITIPAVPGAPANLQATPLRSRVALAWDDPADTPITGYQYRVSTDGTTWAPDWTDIVGSGSETTGYTVTGLNNGTEYTFQVRGVNLGGYGAPAEVKATPVHSPPEFDDGETTSREVAENTGAGIDIGDPVSATDDDGDTLTYELSGAGASNFAVDGAGQISVAAGARLDHETEPSYSVRVTVSDGNGGTDTIIVTITVTDVNEAPGKPDAPTVEAADTDGHNSLTVSWNAPENTGPAITDYDLRFRKGTSGDWTNHTHTGVATSTPITGLDSNTAYQAQVRASNDEGTGTWSDSTTASTAVANLSVSLDSAGYTLAEGGDAATIMVRLDPAADRPVTLPILVTPLTAESTDYTVEGLTDGVLTFSRGEGTKSLTIRPNVDADTDDETVTLAFGTLPAFVTAGTLNMSSVTITDSGDPPVPGETPTPEATETPTPEASPNPALSQAVEEAEPGDDGFPGWAIAAIVVLAIGVTAGALLLVRVRRRLWPPEF